MIRTEDGLKLVPELYAVPKDKVAGEYHEPGSQERDALGRCPFLWAQSLYILGKLLQEVSYIHYMPNRQVVWKYYSFTYINMATSSSVLWILLPSVD
jgi:hypothetical protein